MEFHNFNMLPGHPSANGLASNNFTVTCLWSDEMFIFFYKQNYHPENWWIMIQMRAEKMPRNQWYFSSWTKSLADFPSLYPSNFKIIYIEVKWLTCSTNLRSFSHSNGLKRQKGTIFCLFLLSLWLLLLFIRTSFVISIDYIFINAMCPYVCIYRLFLAIERSHFNIIIIVSHHIIIVCHTS